MNDNQKRFEHLLSVAFHAGYFTGREHQKENKIIMTTEVYNQWKDLPYSKYTIDFFLKELSS
jgi:hypothetical protein